MWQRCLFTTFVDKNIRWRLNLSHFAHLNSNSVKPPYQLWIDIAYPFRVSIGSTYYVYPLTTPAYYTRILCPHTNKFGILPVHPNCPVVAILSRDMDI